MIAFALLLALAQDGDVDRVLLRFNQRRAGAVTQEQFARLLADARAELERFLKDHPAHRDAPRAAFHLAELLASAGEIDAALQKLLDFPAAHPASEHVPSARFMAAELLLHKEDDAAARAAFDEFAKLHPKDERALFARIYAAAALQNEGRHAEAEERLKAARKEHKDRKESWGAVLQLSLLLHVQEKNADARRVLEEVIRECPDREPVEIARRHLSEYLKLGQPPPAFRAKDHRGGDFSLEKELGKVVVLYFFDGAHPASRTEAAFLRKIRDAARPEDLQILGVSVNSDPKDFHAYAEAAKCPWPLHFDPKGFDAPLPRLYDVRALPALRVLDRQGRLRYFNLAGRDLRRAVEKLAQEK
jgi:TolA-binding protein